MSQAKFLSALISSKHSFLKHTVKTTSNDYQIDRPFSYSIKRSRSNDIFALFAKVRGIFQFHNDDDDDDDDDDDVIIIAFQFFYLHFANSTYKLTSQNTKIRHIFHPKHYQN